MRYVDEGDLTASGRLGMMYLKGKGVERNLDLAILHLRKAATGADWWNLELCEALSKSDKHEDNIEGFKICSNMAEQGNARAKARLGHMYRDGRGVSKNLKNAIKWMGRAADDGLEYAKKELENLENSCK